MLSLAFIPFFIVTFLILILGDCSGPKSVKNVPDEAFKEFRRVCREETGMLPTDKDIGRSLCYVGIRERLEARRRKDGRYPDSLGTLPEILQGHCNSYGEVRRIAYSPIDAGKEYRVDGMSREEVDTIAVHVENGRRNSPETRDRYYSCMHREAEKYRRKHPGY